jgi:hypothetical protein
MVVSTNAPAMLFEDMTLERPTDVPYRRSAIIRTLTDALPTSIAEFSSATGSVDRIEWSTARRSS